jgi:signal transduction histidine kinase/ligand-binding sensor domain-containing protein/DNA-binding response OmpR family regulator
MHRYKPIKNIIIKCIFITLVLSVNLLSAASENIKFDRLGPIVIPNCILQDSFGFIWIGAQEGLVRYDGYNLKRYTQIPFDSTSLSNNWVWAIKEDKKGNLWVGSFGGGLNYFDQKTEKFYRYLYETDKPDEISSLNISSILVNENGSLWIGTQNHGLVYMKLDYSGKASYKTFNLSQNPESSASRGDNFVLSLHKDRNSQLWIGTIVGGLKLFDPETGNITHFRHDPENPESLSNNTISSICEDDSGNLWIGTGHYMAQPGNGLNKYDPISKKFLHFKHNPVDPTSLSSNIILSLLIDSEGIMWIGTLGNNLNSIPIAELLSSHKPHFTHHTNFDRSNINSVYEDRLENIWVAPFGRAVYKYNRQQNPFIWYRHIEGNPNSLWSSASVVQVDKSGNIWFGGGALDCYAPESGKYTHYYHDSDNQSGRSLKNITSICEDKYGFLWIGTYSGLHRLDPKTGTFYHLLENPDDPFALRSNIIDEVLTSRSGDLWVASAKSGLQIYDIDEKKFYHFDLDTTNRNDGTIYGIYEDYSGTLWIQTVNHGLYALRIKDNLITYAKHYIHNPNDRNSLSYNLITDIIRPQIIDTSAVWIATGNGLNRLDLNMETFAHFYIEDGLPSNHILKILEDDKGNIWCTCATGLAVYNIKTGMIKSYGKGDGMPIVEFSSRAQNACKTSDGQLIFGAAIGALGFYPEQFTDNTFIPPVYLTEFKIFHESVKLDTAIQFKKDIILNHDQSAFSFEFAALNFTNPEKNEYAYKMAGFHDNWIQSGTEHIASFTNLDPGHYVFHVKGSNNHGVWNDVGTSVNVIILPPWWRTTWAYSVYILLFAFTFYALRTYDRKRQRLKNELDLEQKHTDKLQEIDHMKSRFFANISHEFRTPLTLILGPIEKWLPKLRNLELKTDLSMMQRNANRLYRLITQLLDLSRLESGGMILQARKENIIQLVRGYVQSFESLAKIKKISLKFSAEREAVDLYVDRDKIEKIMYNLLSNAFKFTLEGGEIGVTVNIPYSKHQNTNKFQVPNSNPRAPNYKQIPNSEFGIPNLEFLQITVTNTGPAIPPEQLDKVFDRFYQMDNIHRKNGEGSGIGLALTKELVELHRGKISVGSDMANGTSFYVWLPLGKGHLKDQDMIETNESVSDQFDRNLIYDEYDVRSRKSKTQKGLPLVQVVEDNPDVRFYIRGHLESSFRIIEAPGGREGLAMAIEKIPDLIISDVMMPGMDGLEFCQKLKTDQRTSHIPVILLTARAASEDKIDGLETGADDYLTKPFDAKELLVRIKNLIAQREKLRTHYLKTLTLEYTNTNLTSVDQLFMDKIKSIIDENLADPEFSISKFAREVGFSHSQLIRKLQSLIGLKPSLFIRSYRLLHAKQMFDQKAGNISQIAFDCGFNNLSYFSRSFKRQFGKLPSEYIKQIS